MVGEEGDVVAEPGLTAASRCDARNAACVDCGSPCEAAMDTLYRAYSGPLLRFVRQCGVGRGVPESQLDAEGVVHRLRLRACTCTAVFAL